MTTDHVPEGQSQLPGQPGIFRVLGNQDAGQPDILIYSFDEWIGESKTPVQPVARESRWSLKRVLGLA